MSDLEGAAFWGSILVLGFFGWLVRQHGQKEKKRENARLREMDETVRKAMELLRDQREELEYWREQERKRHERGPFR